MTNKSINIRHATIVGLALNRNCSEIIDEIYYKNEKLYHEAYLQKGLRNDCLKKIFTMKTEDRINKLSGIFEVCCEKKDYILIEKIMRKAHPSIVNFVKKAHIVDIDKFNIDFNLNTIAEDESFSIGISLIYLSSIIYKKQFDGNSYLHFILGKWYDFLQCWNISNIMEAVEDKSFTKEYIDKGYKLFDLEENEKFDCTLEKFIAEDIEKKTFSNLNLSYGISNKELKLLNLDADLYSNAREKVFTEGIQRYIGCLSRYISSLGLESGDIVSDINIDNKILENMFRDFSFGIIGGNNINESDMELYIASCLFIYNLCSLYKECKDIYLNQASEDKYKELQQMEEKLYKEKEKFKEKEFAIKLKMKESNSEIEDLKRKLKELEKENNKLSANALKYKELINELKADNTTLKSQINDLSDNLNNIKNNLLKDDKLSLEDKINYINKFNIGMFGGMNNINKLSDKLTNVTYYNDLNKDISSIDGLDIIFINSTFINHAFSYKIKSVSSKFNVPMDYVSGTNSENIINSIYISLKNKNKNK